VRASGTSRAIAERVCEEMSWQSVKAPGLARVSGIPVSTLRRRLRGETPFLINELEWVAGVLGVPILKLIPKEL
jgi:transcriptional regulator with XRE-family HTH domain